jgi:hypothetical protein
VADGDAWHEGRDGTNPAYREWLYPPPVLVVLVIGLASLMGIAYGAAYGASLGWIAGCLLAAVGMAILTATSTPIRVDDRVLRAGRARLPLGAILEATPLDAEEMRQARRHGDPRAYLVLRAWSSPRGVRVHLADHRDPHPHWLITSRAPADLSAAINAARPDRIPAAGEPE